MCAVSFELFGALYMYISELNPNWYYFTFDLCKENGIFLNQKATKLWKGFLICIFCLFSGCMPTVFTSFILASAPFTRSVVNLLVFKDLPQTEMNVKKLNLMSKSSVGINYLKQKYTRYGCPILGYFRVQVPKNLWKTSSSSFRLAWEFSSKLGT